MPRSLERRHLLVPIVPVRFELKALRGRVAFSDRLGSVQRVRDEAFGGRNLGPAVTPDGVAGIAPGNPCLQTKAKRRATLVDLKDDRFDPTAPPGYGVGSRTIV